MLEGATEYFDVTAQTAMASNFLVNLLLTGALNYLWGMINCLQIIAHFSLINVMMPANCHVIFKIFAKIATFDLIPVYKIIEAINQFLGVKDQVRL